MKRPTAASLKKVTPENLARLGSERLAELLVAAAENRPELKRRLRMELAAEQGAEQLLVEIDRRLDLIGGSRGRVSWRQRHAFVRDLEALRALVTGRLAELDASAAADRVLRFLGLARGVYARVRDKEGRVAAVFERAAADAGRLIAASPEFETGPALAAAITRSPAEWAVWLPIALAQAPPDAARAVLSALPAGSAGPGWITVARELAAAARDPDAFRATFGVEALKAPSVAAEVATRFLEAGNVEEAGAVLAGAVTKGRGRSGKLEPDFDWETAWIAWLEASGDTGTAQKARWASFQRTLSAERLKAYTARLPDFEDVEAEHRAFDLAAGHPDFGRGLRLLMEMRALPEAAGMIAARADEIDTAYPEAEAWAAMLSPRQPSAAHTLLRRAAAAAFRRRDFATCDRLTAAADALVVD